MHRNCLEDLVTARYEAMMVVCRHTNLLREIHPSQIMEPFPSSPTHVGTVLLPRQQNNPIHPSSVMVTNLDRINGEVSVTCRVQFPISKEWGAGIAVEYSHCHYTNDTVIDSGWWVHYRPAGTFPDA